MFIVQKNFEMTVPAIQNPYLRSRVQLPERSVVPVWQQEPSHSVNPADSHRPDLVNSSFNPELNDSLVGNPVERAIRRQRAAETDAILTQNAQSRNESLLNKHLRDQAAKEQAAASSSNVAETIQDTPIIEEPAIEEKALPKRSLLDTAKVKAEVAATNTKKAAKEGLSKAKNKVVEVAGKMSEAYGDGITGSLAGDAALAAGGLALAGGAYHLLKKRRAKKKAEKEALKSRIKK